GGSGAGAGGHGGMLVSFRGGGRGLGLTVGLLDVLVLHADAIKAQNRASGGLDLALGIPLVAIGALLAANRLHRRQRRPAPPPPAKRPSKLGAWARRGLHEPHYPLAILIGAVVGTPGAAYLLMLHDLVSGKSPTAVQVVAVIVFVTINFALVIIPFASYMYRPLRTEKAIKQFKDWLTSHERQIAAAVALFAGGYMVISGLVRVT